MAKQKSLAVSSVLQEIFHVGLYKQTQGRVTRQVTFFAAAIAVVLVAWRLSAYMNTANLPEWLDVVEKTLPVRVIIPWAVAFIGLWISYRAVNFPRCADFLIGVQAELNKVSWPTRGELVRSSIVVIVVIFSMAAVLFLFDLFWQWLFRLIGVLS